MFPYIFVSSTLQAFNPKIIEYIPDEESGHVSIGKDLISKVTQRFESDLHDVKLHNSKFASQAKGPVDRLAPVQSFQAPVHTLLNEKTAAKPEADEVREDIRQAHEHLHDPDPAAYPIAQRFAAERRQQGSWGLLYRSVRHPAGECAALFRPPAASIPHQGVHLRYVWDGKLQRITDVFTLKTIA